ncbi:DUF3552 domain-containing protein [Candidatus Peregrinibacteria bacterium]|nr:DUF3552 domain-containing protein [Candidatus Peregrinibacteria bacterium]
MLTFPELLTGLGILAASTLFTAFIGWKSRVNLRQTKKDTEHAIETAKSEAQSIIEQANSELEDIKKIAHEETEQLAAQIKRTEDILTMKESFFQKRTAKGQEITSQIAALSTEIRRMKSEMENLDQKMSEKLVAIAGVGKSEIKLEIVRQLENQVLAGKDNFMMKSESAAKDTAQRQAQKIILASIQKYASPTSSERSSSTVKLSRDEIKGQFVGKNEQNLLFFEESAEVDVIFNDMPKTINISAYNLVKRQIAVRALGKLVSKRSPITKDLIKKCLEEAEKETDEVIMEIGHATAKVMDLKNIPDELIHIIGRLNFRTSYGQNILKHSIEVSAIATVLAYELGANIETCRLAAFFHDIGKAVDYEREGAHDDLSKEILEKFNFSPEIVYAAYAHHDKVPANTIPAMIVKASDAISAGRPGARLESLDKYLERLKNLEKTAQFFEGVKKTFAISAGRELRIIVDHEKITDEGVSLLAKNVARKIETDLTYPGKIKVNVIRKTKAVDYAL